MMKFASEAWLFVGPVLGVSAVFLVWGGLRHSGALLGWGVAVLVIALAVLAFFRDPQRTVPAGDALVLSPADGKVMLAETLADGRQHVAIFLSVFNVHINRAPVTSTVAKVTRTAGTYFHAGTPQAGGNARVDVEAESDFGPVQWRQVSGLIARKIACYLKPGDRVRAGEKYGLIYFGSRMDVYLPSAARLTTKPGRRVTAGETVIAQFSTEDVR